MNWQTLAENERPRVTYGLASNTRTGQPMTPELLALYARIFLRFLYISVIDRYNDVCTYMYGCTFLNTSL